MKRTLLNIIIVILISGPTFSQSFDWLQTVTVDYEFNPGMIQYTTCANPQGGSYLFGIQEHITFYNQSMGSLFLKKFNVEGEEIWTRTIEGQSSAGGAFCNENGDIFIIGQMYTDVDFWGEGSLVKTGIGTDGYLARVNSEGSLEWSINLTSLPMGEGTATDLAFDDLGRPFLAYSTWLDSYVLIFNEDGDYLQAIVQEDVSLISGLDLDANGNLYTTGSCAGYNSAFNGVPYPAPFSYTTYLVKYDNLYQPVWVKFIEDITCSFPQVKVDDAGETYFAGSLLSGTNFDTIAINGPTWVYDFFLARLDTEGNYQWVVECPEVLTGDATLGSLHYLDIDTEGNALMTGITRGIVDWGSGIVSDVTANYQDIIVWSYAEDGSANWVKTAGGEGSELAHTISAGTDGNAYLAGVIQGSVVFDTIVRDSEDFADPFLVQLDLGIMTLTPEYELNKQVEVYPNPASNKVHVLSGETLSEFSIYNNTGLLLRHGKLTGDKPEISVSGLPPGMYLLSFESQDAVASHAKLIVK